MARRLCKVTPQQLDVIKDRFHSFLGGNSNIVADEAFFNAVQSYYEGIILHSVMYHITVLSIYSLAQD